MLKILSYAQKIFFLHINEETLALSHLSLGNMNGGLKNQLMNIFLLPQLEEDQLGTPEGSPAHGNQHVNRKHHLEEESLKELNSSKTTLKIYIKSYQKILIKPQNYFTMIILNWKVGNYTIYWVLTYLWVK